MEKMNELKEIIFVDSLTSINEIENFSIKLNTKFITFDYDSHLKLKNRKI